MSGAPPPRLVLASGSPQRRALLRDAGLDPTVVPADLDETPHPGEAPGALVERLARAKAGAVARAHPGSLVLGADTVVELDGAALGKPVDDEDARRMLHAVAGRRVVVRSGVALVAPHPAGASVDTASSAGATAGDAATVGRSTRSGRVDTTLWLRPLDAAEVEAYVATGEPRGAAGAFRVQDTGASLLQRHRGCWTNVVGLPLCLVGALLADHGVTPPAEPPHA